MRGKFRGNLGGGMTGHFWNLMTLTRICSTHLVTRCKRGWSSTAIEKIICSHHTDESDTDVADLKNMYSRGCETHATDISLCSTENGFCVDGCVRKVNTGFFWLIPIVKLGQNWLVLFGSGRCGWTGGEAAAPPSPEMGIGLLKWTWKCQGCQ